MEEVNDIIINIASMEVIKSERGESAEYKSDEKIWGEDFVKWCIKKATNKKCKNLKEVRVHYPIKDNINPGDIVTFYISKGSYHYGIIYKIDNKYIYTIEGSTRSGSLGGIIYRGNDVARRSYPIGYARICCILKVKDCITNIDIKENTIEYSKEEFGRDVRKLLKLSCDDSVEDVAYHTPTISIKTKNTNKLVLPVQKRLKALGYYKGEINENEKAVFDADLSDALVRFQKDNVENLNKRATGVLGSNSVTWTTLLEIE